MDRAYSFFYNMGMGEVSLIMVKHIVFILRGISGAGKSTFAKEFAKYCFANRVDCTVVSADDFFEDHEGGYKFNINLLSFAHGNCLKQFIGSMEATDPEENHVIIVDNTNLTRDEVLPYVTIAAAYEYEVNIMDFKVDIETAYGRAKHGVPYSGLQNQMDRWEWNKAEVLFKPYFKEVKLFQHNHLDRAILSLTE